MHILIEEILSNDMLDDLLSTVSINESVWIK